MATKKKTVRKKVVRRKTVARKKAPVRKRVKKKVDKTIIFMKGSTTVAKRRKKRKAPKRVYRKRRVAKRRYYGAARRPAAAKGIMALLMQGAGITGGAVGGSMIARAVPIKDLKIKSLVPIGVGILIMSTKMGKKGFMKDAALGSTAIGFISLLKTFVPNIPLLAADEEDLALLGMADDLLDEERAMLGEPYDGDDDIDELDDLLEGEEDDLEDDEEYMGIPIGQDGMSPADF